jgi:hypothetical protein
MPSKFVEASHIEIQHTYGMVYRMRRKVHLHPITNWAMLLLIDLPVYWNFSTILVKASHIFFLQYVKKWETWKSPSRVSCKQGFIMTESTLLNGV